MAPAGHFLQPGTSKDNGPSEKENCYHCLNKVTNVYMMWLSNMTRHLWGRPRKIQNMKQSDRKALLMAVNIIFGT